MPGSGRAEELAGREYVRFWAELTGAGRVEAVSAADDARLIEDALMAGEMLPAGDGLSYLRSHVEDTARSEERTFVATSSPADQGVYNNWRPAGEMRALLKNRMRGASAGKTRYVAPYLMAPPGSPPEASPDDLETILTIDTQRRRQELAHREQHLAQFSGLPEQIWQAHRRVAAALETTR
jgi:GTP-dependent phosphoenolpyruvate carboxykinase